MSHHPQSARGGEEAVGRAKVDGARVKPNGHRALVDLSCLTLLTRNCLVLFARQQVRVIPGFFSKVMRVRLAQPRRVSKFVDFQLGEQDGVGGQFAGKGN